MDDCPGAEQVGLHHGTCGVEVGGRCRLGPVGERGGVVDQHIEWFVAERFGDGRDAGRIVEVEAHGSGSQAVAAQRRRHDLGCVEIACGDQHLVPGGCELACYGADVTGVCNSGKADLVHSLGAQHVIDYAVDDATDGSRRYDLIVDIAGNAPLRRLHRTLEPTGSLVIVGGESKGNFTGGLGRSLRVPLVSLVVRPRLTMLVSKEHHDDLAPLTELIEAGRLSPGDMIERSFDRSTSLE